MGERAVRMQAGEPSLLTEDDLWLFAEGSHSRLYEVLGAHPLSVQGTTGTLFAVWAPDAEAVSVVGDFNSWDPSRHRMRPHRESGIWECFVPGVGPGALYKYHLASRHGPRVLKSDPFAFYSEVPPRSASVVWDLAYPWGDAAWLRRRGPRNALDAPIAIYEVHLGSWRRKDDGRYLTYRELGPLLAAHVRDTGFTHVEFLPVMEHPFYGSWGYQTTGYFAPTSRYGTPQDFMALVDHLHQREIGVILDWVPSHFATDGHGLGQFDGSHLYEHADPRRGVHPDWGSYTFNYNRHEVRSFLLSSALFWLDRYHADGLRLDAVASMLYLDYSRRPGEWLPNEQGGREDLAAIAFLRRLNEEVYRRYPDVQTIAEESTAWPMVSRPTWMGGLGFGLKWDMGWMHDTLIYMSKDPIHRQHHHDKLTFRMLYAAHENFVLPLSHDEVVHGKGSLLGKMPGDDWQKFANLRLLLGYLYASAGKKLLFMGGEIGQWGEWDHERALDWPLLEHGPHRGLHRWVADLNHLYRSEPALHTRDCGDLGFEWVEPNDAASSVVAFLRRGHSDRDVILVVGNFTPVVRSGYRIGVPHPGRWAELLNGDAVDYGGSGQGNLGGTEAEPIPAHGFTQSLSLTLPPLAMLFLKPSTA
ncbi:MAG: 1,4-alpha-glucan (glycogen) branching enzyme, GH-13-type [Candidatus Bipolaricaulis sibiricus]|uniref:1,4-alpha-glucan branching enzyme GlgB n=1 Tax=Bipolaricaulis sibiricus TaxID=2501609 RepID=A0A410FV04_BIPS1|nr:MAG: 1,4-alpha-glucan (glycogen) branching enzyme, GH-13-type [Candidatus Bipolaricaulis sibiricus]